MSQADLFFTVGAGVVVLILLVAIAVQAGNVRRLRRERTAMADLLDVERRNAKTLPAECEQLRREKHAGRLANLQLLGLLNQARAGAEPLARADVRMADVERNLTRNRNMQGPGGGR